ncbi:MAG: M20/M25/M40 family metallo-hydrolase [Acidobacteria bacterium]|nr:M20/M25/M40 family metallo-hydrolase [Acidobacteriota bacterium]
MRYLLTCLLLCGVTVAACAKAEPPDQVALRTITADDLLRHISTLASDEFEGRLPGTKGEELTVKYLEDAFRGLGLGPGNPDGTYVQEVPLVGIKSTPSVTIEAGGRPLPLVFKTDYVLNSRRTEPLVEVKDTEVVFVGYGVVAPEYGWDDYKDVDVRGKTILMLVNDPAVPDPADPTALDPDMFRGKAMTYYGRWTYKYEIASEKGAAAAIIVHETGPAGYPWEVVVGSWGAENFDLRRADGNAGRVPVEGWITIDKAQSLVRGGGFDFFELKRAATAKDFRPVTLKARASFSVANEMRDVASRNVIARLEGADPQRRDEHVIYTAHWDHLGRDESLEGDQIYNGAVDNATGTASLLEVAKAFTALPEKPQRSVVFLAVTAEEQGLLGAKYYAEHPLYPLSKALANINMDAMNPWGPTSDIVIIGLGNSTLDDLASEVAATQGRAIIGDPEPEKGFFYRSDHFELAKQGVPALYADSGPTFVGKPDGYGQEKRDAFTANDYHKPSDEVKPDWDLGGMVEDTQFMFLVGYRVLQATTWPEWKPGTEFKAVREAMLAGR